MNKFKLYLPSSLKSGLAYGSGLAFGNLVTALIFSRTTLENFSPGNDFVRLAVGVILAFFISAFGGAIGGYLGGRTLPVVDHLRARRAYAWKSALALGLIYGFLLFPLVLALALFSFYNIGDIAVWLFMALFGFVGLLVGLLFGLIFGGWTVGLRRTWRVIGYALLGFGLGGLGLGWGVHQFIYSYDIGRFSWEGRAALLGGLFLFGLGGGAAVGLAYARYAAEPAADKPLFAWLTPAWRWAIGVGLMVIALLVFVRPALSLVRNALQPQDANLSTVLVSQTVGTHWLEPVDLSGAFEPDTASAAQIDVTDDGQIGLVWVTNGAVWYMPGIWEVGAKTTTWQESISVSGEGEMAESPQIALDAQGRAHVVWAEAGDIFYSQCADTSCSTPERVSALPALACAGEAAGHQAPAVAVSPSGSLLLVWETDSGVLPGLVWSAGDSPQTAVGECVPAAGLTAARQPRVSAVENGRFGLVFTAGVDADSRVYYLPYENGWGEWQEVGNGRYPEIYIDNESQTHVIWCGQEGLAYWQDQQPPLSLRTPCFNRPQLGIDSGGHMHAVWYADIVENVFGIVNTNPVLYEIAQHETGWTQPTVIDRVSSQIQPAVVTDKQGTFHMVRTMGRDPGHRLQYQAQVQYSCEGYELTRLGQILYDVARLETYRDPDDLVPYCQNRYETLLFTPNANPAYSDVESLVNGAYDQMVQVVDTAQYEILLSTMWYDANDAGESPGFVLAETVADLYRKVKTNPDAFPRGLTVRILLGNPPEFATGDFTGQLWSVLQDIRDAGVLEMTNQEIGWNLEVADYKGALPHSHTKMLIVDGKTVVAAGYNMTYEHYTLLHPSGRGGGRNDLGIQVTGPVAQDAVLAFDDLWVGSNQRHCTNLDAANGVWQVGCYDFKATGWHVPEVMKYYIPAGESNAFSMFRSHVRDESDHQIADALAAAETSIDTMQVNFTLELICDLNILYDICTFQEALPYMESLVTAAENGAQVRILIKGAPADGIESAVAVNILQDELRERGLQDQVELRYFDGPMHYKSINIDGELVIVGSQNFHYSALKPLSGLAEYNLGVVDEEAAADYTRLFEYHWQQGTPWETANGR